MPTLSFAATGFVRGLAIRISGRGYQNTFLPVCPSIQRMCTMHARAPFEPSVVLRRSAIVEVEDILKHKFNDRSLLAQALTHRSVANASLRGIAFFEDADSKFTEVPQNNERLELLGDRVLGLLVAQILYERDSTISEGRMSIMSQSLISRRNADAYSRSLGLDKFVLQAEDLQGKQGSRYGDCFEALLGALFLDGGYEAARSFFVSRVVPVWDTLDGSAPRTGCYKRDLQEYLVSQGLPSPALATQLKYVTVRYDPEEQKFSQTIQLFGRRVAIGTGPTRVSADQAAARSLLERLQRAKATCFLIRLARRADDKLSLAKLQAVRTAQVAANNDEVGCS